MSERLPPLILVTDRHAAPARELPELLEGIWNDVETAVESGDFFGRSLALLGDLDGDGVPDLAVGADLA